MSLLPRGYSFYRGSELIDFLETEGADLPGAVVHPENDGGIQHYYWGSFSLKTEPESGDKSAAFEPHEAFKDKVGSLVFAPADVAFDGLGYVLSRKPLADQ